MIDTQDRTVQPYASQRSCVISRQLKSESIMKQAISYQPLSLLAASALFVALLGGCASTESVTHAQATADSALSKANEASASASAAKADAAQASQKADQAKASAAAAESTAAEAKATADAAKAEVDRLAEKIDRMFKKTMQK
ncbi:alanine-zipper protein [Thiobacillus sp.]|uniref:alanine-zipper protein n=1 Tax=Thiobacillus sp. TaxID=924 RepID=UPI00286EB31C|nr:alanine-zipper protein [Thiobacillus sp.]